MNEIDVLGIGDITTDVFIKLKDAEVICDANKENCKLSLDYGSKIPYESAEEVRAVGNSSNAAVSAARLGLKSALLAYIGDDDNGKKCLEELQKNNVGSQYVRVEAGKKTNYHYVLWYDVDRTILIKQEEFNYAVGDISVPKWIYLSSLPQNSTQFHTEIAEYLAAHPEVKLAFQPGTFQMKLGTEKLQNIYARTEIFICNVQEAELILKNVPKNLPMLLRGIAALGPKIVVITDGYDGAYAYDTRNPDDMWFMPIYPHTPFERTGAGDAYASTIVSALAMGKTLAEAMLLAPINAMSVTQFVGAQKGLLSMQKIEEYLAKAPADYKLRKL